MGLFDIFTGDPAKKAAEENKRLLEQNKAEGTAALQGGQANAIGALDQSAGYYKPLAQKYGAATSLGLDALGVNGPQGNQNATDAFHAGPGYQWGVDQALQNVLRTANANGGGGVASGNTLAALSDRAGNMANQEYGGWLDRLNGYVSPELAATGGMANATMAKAPVYTNTANNIASLGTNTVNGVTNQNTQAANAEMAGSGNMWGLGLNLAKLGVGALSGGTSLLGGGGGGSGSSMGSMQVGNQLFPAFG
jgi:hypothetical protein